MTGQWVLGQDLLDQAAEPIEAASQIYGRDRDEDSRRSGNAQHGRRRWVSNSCSVAIES